MAKGGKRATQPSEEPQNQLKVLEGESRVDLGEEEIDPETLRNLVAAMQAEMAALNANQENIAETIILQHTEIDR